MTALLASQLSDLRERHRALMASLAELEWKLKERGAPVAILRDVEGVRALVAAEKLDTAYELGAPVLRRAGIWLAATHERGTR